MADRLIQSLVPGCEVPEAQLHHRPDLLVAGVALTDPGAAGRLEVLLRAGVMPAGLREGLRRVLPRHGLAEEESVLGTVEVQVSELLLRQGGTGPGHLDRP